MAIVSGTSTNNLLRGSWGDDVINGGAGADTLYGGGGNDIYYVDNVHDVIRESPIYNNTAVQLASLAAGGTLGNGASGSYALAISGNGNLVGFYSNSDNLFAGDANDHHEFDIKNMTSGAVVPAMTQAGNAPVPSGAGGGAQGDYGQLHITPDGTYVVYCSTSVGIIPALDDTTDADIFVKNLLTGAVTIESQPTGSGVSSYHASTPDISDNGRYVTFTQMDNLVNGVDLNGSSNTDVYWRDRVTGILKMVSGEFDGSYQGNSDSDNASVTNDGRFVLFESTSDNFLIAGDTNHASDLFVRDMVSDSVTLVSASALSPGLAANSSSYDGQITGDGHYIVYTSQATDLIAGDTSNLGGVFRQDLVTGSVIRVNSTAAGVASEWVASHPQISPDGRYVVFESSATDLLPLANDSNAITKVFVKDLVSGGIEMVGRTTAGQLDLSNSCYAPQISDDGRYIAFFTRNALVAADTNLNDDVYRIPNPLYSPGDEVRSTVSYTLPTGLEKLTLLGRANINASGNAAANLLTGNAGANQLDGGAGNDTMSGGDASDTYYVRDRGDRVIESNPNARLGGTDQVNSYLTAYTLGSNVENGRIITRAAANLTGNSLNNVLFAGVGNNVLAGASGTDTVSYLYGSGSTGVRVSLALTAAQNSIGSGHDTLTGIENLSGSAYADTLTGNAGNNVLAGGQGNDILTGGAGQDSFRFDSALSTASIRNLDTITDFRVIDDSFQLENAIFTKLVAGGLAADRFVSNNAPVALDANDYILHDRDSGKLYYDADGNGAGAAIQIASIGINLALTHADFLVT